MPDFHGRTGMQEGVESKHFLQLEEKRSLMSFALPAAPHQTIWQSCFGCRCWGGWPSTNTKESRRQQRSRPLSHSRGDRGLRVPTHLLVEVGEMSSMVWSPKKPSGTSSVLSHTTVFVNLSGGDNHALIRRHSRETSRVTLVGFRWDFWSALSTCQHLMHRDLVTSRISFSCKCTHGNKTQRGNWICR